MQLNLDRCSSFLQLFSSAYRAGYCEWHQRVTRKPSVQACGHAGSLDHLDLILLSGSNYTKSHVDMMSAFRVKA